MWESCTCSFADAFPSSVDEFIPVPTPWVADSSTPLKNESDQNIQKQLESEQQLNKDYIITGLRERDSLMVKLEEAEREIKILKTERRMNRLEIEKLKEARSKIQEDLEAIQ